MLNFLECDFVSTCFGRRSSGLFDGTEIGTVFATTPYAITVYSRGNLGDDFCYVSDWIFFTLAIFASLILFLMTSYILASYTSVIFRESGITFALWLSCSDIFSTFLYCKLMAFTSFFDKQADEDSFRILYSEEAFYSLNSVFWALTEEIDCWETGIISSIIFYLLSAFFTDYTLTATWGTISF